MGVDVLLVQFALGDPAVVPAGELLRRADAIGRMAGDVCLLGGEHGAGFRGDEVEEDEELGVQLVMGAFNLQIIGKRSLRRRDQIERAQCRVQGACGRALLESKPQGRRGIWRACRRGSNLP